MDVLDGAPEPRVPSGDNLVLSPGHGKVDVIDTTTEPQFMGGDCQRLSMFLSLKTRPVERKH